MIRFKVKDLLAIAGYSSVWKYNGGHYNLKVKNDHARMWFDESSHKVIVEKNYDGVWIVKQTYTAVD